MSVTAPKKIARYEVISHLETGGMGSVFLARDPAIDRLVAIKLLREGFDNAELRERFVREARSAGRLKHINIVTIFDVGEHGNEPFIAMEYIEGETLSALVRRNAPLTLGRKLQLMDELCAGLQYAHRAGIVHRDIKPKNIMLDRDGVLKVLDFGIARVSDAAGGLKTQAGMLMGTLNYMAPEQMMGLPDVDARADIFAAGAVFYELLAYRQAFPGGLETGILHKIINAAPDSLRAIDPHLDHAVIELVDRCLEKSRESRFPDMAAVRRQLALLKRRYPVEEEDDPHKTIQVPKPVFSPEPPNQPAPRPAKRNTTELDRLRAEQIRGHLEDGRAALQREDFTAAFEASQRALLLDDNNADALDLEHRARTALDERQIAEWLATARGELTRGALTSASMLVENALGLNASSAEAAAVRAKVEEARRELAEAQARARAVTEALARARTALATGALEEASARVNEALALDAQNQEALAARREVEAAIKARQRAADEARAGKAVKEARDQFASGARTAAIAALEHFEPAALVADVLNELRVEFKEMERLRIEAERQAEERRKAVEAAELLRKATARTLDDAATRLQAQDLDGARALTRDILRRQPDHSEARALDARIEQAIELRRQVAAGLATAKKHIDAGRFEDARRALVDVETLDAAAPEIVTLRRAADAGIRAAELEARRLREAEERRAKELAEAEAKAALQKQREAEQRQREAEQKQREAEQKQREAEERRAKERADAEAKAALQKQREAEQRQRDAEKKAREEDEKRKREQAEQKKREDAEKRRRDDERARREAELRAAEEARNRIAGPLEETWVLKKQQDEPPVRPPVPEPEPEPAPQPEPEPWAKKQDRESVVGPDAPPAPPQPRLTAKLAAIAAGALAVVVFAVWMFGTSPPTPPDDPILPVTQSGTVVLDILPWASVEAITSKADNKPVQSGCSATPCVLTLSPGEYHVRATNPNFPGALEFDMTVTADVVREERRALPGFRAEDEISKIVGGGK
jgi:serine/threonine protein kinase